LRDEERERDDADLWELLARSWERAGDRAHAQAAWGEVVRIDPSDEEAAEKVGVKP
jgi:predicted Zn-dependent protease